MNPEDGETSNNTYTFRSGDDEEDNNGSSSGGEEEEVEDRLSSLPDILLVDILSLLPIHSAAATSALSRRWQHLWTQLTRLRFSGDDSAMWLSFDSDYEIHNICPIIDRIFHQLISPKILSFHLDFQSIPEMDHWESYTSCVQHWIRHVCGRNVEELKVLPSVNCYDSFIPLPTCVFETQSLVVLHLGPSFIYELPANNNGIISLPNLRKLRFCLQCIDLELMRLLFESCPLLEDLVLHGYFRFQGRLVDILSQHLKRLAILGSFSKRVQFRIDAPELEHFEVSTHDLSSYCFVRDLSRLLEAEISVGPYASKRLNNIAEFVQGISSVRSLYLSNTLFNFSRYLLGGAVPIFRNLTHLETNLFGPHGWNCLMRFLQSTPILEVLVLSHDDNDAVDCDTETMHWTMPNSIPVCLLNKLKRMEIRRFQKCQKELDFLGYVLSNANVLKRLILRDFDCCGGLWRELKFCDNLFSCPRSSIACEIEVCGEYLSASSKGFNQNFLDCRIYCPLPLVPYDRFSV